MVGIGVGAGVVGFGEGAGVSPTNCDSGASDCSAEAAGDPLVKSFLMEETLLERSVSKVATDLPSRDSEERATDLE